MAIFSLKNTTRMRAKRASEFRFPDTEVRFFSDTEFRFSDTKFRFSDTELRFQVPRSVFRTKSSVFGYRALFFGYRVPFFGYRAPFFGYIFFSYLIFFKVLLRLRSLLKKKGSSSMIVIHFSGVVERLLNLSSRSRAAAYPTSNGH